VLTFCRATRCGCSTQIDSTISTALGWLPVVQCSQLLRIELEGVSNMLACIDASWVAVSGWAQEWQLCQLLGGTIVLLGQAVNPTQVVGFLEGIVLPCGFRVLAMHHVASLVFAAADFLCHSTVRLICSQS
jgi:hypothetical protein